MSLIDPDDDESLRATDPDVIAESARGWAGRGAPQLSLRLYRAVLKQRPDHVEALTQLAKAAAAAADVDAADSYYRRADAIGALTPDAYELWFTALLGADRRLQASIVAQRFLALYRGLAHFRALGAFWLAQCGDGRAAWELVEETATAPGTRTRALSLDDETATRLIKTLRLLAKEPGPWSGRLAEVHDVARALAAGGERNACLTAAELAMEYERFPEAAQYLRRLEDMDGKSGREPSDPTAVRAKLLSAHVAVRMNRHNEAAELFRTLVLMDAPEWKDRRPEWNVSLAGALYAAGHVVEANKIAEDIITEIRPAGGRLAGSESEWLVRAQLIRVQAEYDSGRFQESWNAVRSAVEYSASPDLPKSIRAELLRLRCRLEPENRRRILTELAALRAPDGWATEEGRAVELTWLETLAWLSDHSAPREPFRREAEVALGDSLAMFRNTARAYGSTFREAYVALLAGKDSRAWQVLQDQDPEQDWRAMAIKARAALGIRKGREAFALYDRVLGLCGHSLDLRCGFVQAALFTDQPELATRAANGIVRFAPNHVQARILLAECLSEADRKNRALGEANGKASTEHVGSVPAGAARAAGARDAPRPDAKAPLLLIEAVHEYTQAFRLHDALESYLLQQKTTDRSDRAFHVWDEHGPHLRSQHAVAGSPRPIGSDLMAYETLQHAAKMGSHAAIRAGMALAKAHLPQDRLVRKEGRELIRRVELDDPQEGRRLNKLLKRPRHDGRKSWALKYVPPAAAVALILIVALQGSTIPAIRDVPDDVRVMILGLLGAAVIWPFVTSIKLPGGLGIEKSDVVSPVSDDDIPLTGSVRTRLELRELLRLPQPSDVQATMNFRPQKAAGRNAKDAVALVEEQHSGWSQAREGQEYARGMVRRDLVDDDTD